MGATSSTLRLTDFLRPVLESTGESACNEEGVPDTDDEVGELSLSIFAVVPPFSRFCIKANRQKRARPSRRT
jgi:hypothetical protein